MKNIFIKLKQTATIKQQALQKLFAKEEEEQEQSHPLIDAHFQKEDHSDQENAKFILELIQKTPETEIKDKLYPILVYYTSNLPEESILKTLNLVLNSAETIFNRVKFFSLVFKSIKSIATKKWLITNSIGLIEKETKISIYSNFVENFDSLIRDLTFSFNQYAQINLKMVNYLQKHLVYKKLWKHYIVQCLIKTQSDNACTSEVDALIIKLLKSGDVTQETVALISHKQLEKNQYFSYLKWLLLGDFEAFNTAPKDILEKQGVNINELERNIKIQALPRILNGIKVASYSQISEILKINKGEVESYIIEAIQNGLLKAKIDEFQETILITQLRFRALRGEDSASLQKNISTVANRLQKIAAIQ